MNSVSTLGTRSSGYFITVEGPEGAGKSTMIQGLAERLSGLGLELVLTREPGGIEIAEKIRDIILDLRHTAMDARTEALLYAAARRQHLAEKVLPALHRGAAVICDRFIDSSLAYQGHARGLGIDDVWAINAFATQGVWPDVTLYLDIEPEEGLRRIAASDRREVNRLDLEKIEFHRRVLEGYMKILERFPDRIALIDASLPPEEVARRSADIVIAKLDLTERR